MLLHLAGHDKTGAIRNYCPNPIALANYLLKLMSFYYPNNDPSIMHNISSYFLSACSEATRFREFSCFLTFENPILSFCRVVSLADECKGSEQRVDTQDIRANIFKILTYILKESLSDDFKSLRATCPWLFLNLKDQIGRRP